MSKCAERGVGWAVRIVSMIVANEEGTGNIGTEQAVVDWDCEDMPPSLAARHTLTVFTAFLRAGQRRALQWSSFHEPMR